MKTARWCFLVSVTIFAMGANEPGSGVHRTDLVLLQGRWKLVSAHDNGQLRGANANVVVVDRKGWHTPADTFKYELYPLRSPKQIDWTLDDRVWKGIYELTPTTLRLCVAPPGKPRPSEFKTTAGDQRKLHVRKRVVETD